MKNLPKRLLAICLVLALLGTFVLQAAPVAQAADYLTSLPQKHYGEYGTVNMVYDYGSCYSMQGVATDANYTYCAKIGSNDAIAMIVRLNKSDGAKVNMTNASNGGYYFYNLGHANALDIAKINGVQQMFVTGGANLIRLTMNGTTLTTAGTYTATYNGASASMTAAQIMYASSKEVGIMVKSGRTLYTGTLDPTVSSGNIELVKLCTLDVTNVRLKGQMQDYSTYVQQGFDYCDGKVFLPLSGNAYVETINQSVVLVYDVEGATGTVRNDPTLSFRIISGQYSGLFEIEDVEVCDYDGKLYFSSNRRKTETDTNYDGVSFFAGYVYDPAMSTLGPADYRWETVDNEWVTVMDGGNTFNNAIRVNGAISDNTMSASVYHMSRSVVLKHDKPWVVEWKSSGSFKGGGMLLHGGKTSNAVDEPYIFRFENSTFISMGYFDGTQHNNYGIKLSDHGINGLEEHVYRLTNKIDDTGYNLVYLSVDGEELGALNNYYIGLSDQNTKIDWVTGKDLTFSYQGTLDNPLNQCQLDYLQVWADGVPADPSNTYRWESTNDNLTSVTGGNYTENIPTIYNGSVSGTTYTNACFRLDKPVKLLHDRQWSIEWQSEGTTSSVFLLSAAEGGKNPNAPYLFRYGSNLFFLGANDGTQHANYGIDISKHGIDGTAKHTYRLTNKVASDGSNMAYLYVDGVEIGPMNNFYSGVSDKNTTSNWLNGRDLVFDYVGNRSYAMGGDYTYLQIIEDGCDHSYTSKVTTAPGCESAGVKTFTCSTCGDKYTEPLAATGHNYTSKVTDPTCTEKGYTTYTCACGHSYKADEKAALGHSYATVTVDATCNKDGSVTKTCSTCGDKQVQAIPATGHSYTAVVIAPTCTNKGYTSHTCKNCKDIYTSDEVAATGHSYTSKVTTTATCTKDGVRTYTCSNCGGHYTESIPATGHKYSSKVTAPTCTAKGYTTYTCACGHSYKADEKAALGHKYQAVITTDPGCESAGVKTFTCSTCGDQYTEPLAATGHNYTSKVTAPTCTEKGYTTYTCTCGHSYKADEKAALGHSYKSVTVDATCTTDGSVTKTCSTCGDKQVTTVPATGHSHTAKVMAPTCTTKGYTTYTCHCGDAYTADEVASLGHSYETVTVDATCTADGSVTDICATCGDTQVQVIPAAGHSFADGTCGTCGEADPDYVKPVVQPTLTLKSPTLEFKDMICIVAFYTAENTEDVVEMGMITYTEKVDVVDINTAAYVIPGANFDEGSGRYYSSSQGIHAKYLGDTVYLACYAKLTDGSYVYTKLAPYSPINYATNQLKNSTNTELKQLVVAMLNYGAAAQLFFEHNVDNLANASLTEEQLALPEDYREDMAQSVPAAPAEKLGAFTNNLGFSVRKPAISFEGAFCINYFFTPKYEPVDGITLYYWNEADYNAASVLTTVNATGTLKLEGSGVEQYRGDITGISAKNLSQAVYVAAVYSDGTTTWTSGVLGYSIGAYCASQASKGGDIAPLAMATAVYGYHAKQYFSE